MKRAALPLVVLTALIFLSCVLVLFMTGCTSTGQKKENYWKSQIGVAKYDDVVTRLGPPTARETLSDKSFVAKWVRTSQTVSQTDLWTEVLVMRFSSEGVLRQLSVDEY